MKRPGRADITPTRSDSRAASSRAWVISSTVAPVSRHSRSNSSPISSRRLLVQRTERLVQQDQARLHHQRAGDAHALPHAAGQLRRVGACELPQAHEADGVVHPALHLRRVQRRRGATRRRRCPPRSARGSSHPPGTPRPTPSGTVPCTAWPSNRIVPAEGGFSPASTSSRVDLPQPDGPTTAKNSPRARSRSIGPSACSPPG